jgi:hypothetical protein
MCVHVCACVCMCARVRCVCSLCTFLCGQRALPVLESLPELRPWSMVHHKLLARCVEARHVPAGHVLYSQVRSGSKKTDWESEMSDPLQAPFAAMIC